MPAIVERSTSIEGIALVRFQKFADSRGYFYESYRKSLLPEARDMVQGNCSFSKAGVLRGMHYHHKQADLWSVPVGRVRAALFDARPGSPTFRTTQVLEMSPEEPTGLYIPKGVAHGFYAIADSIMTYMVDEYYDGDDELGIRWDDPAMAIDWKLGGVKPELSDRDATNPLFSDIPSGSRPR